MPNLANNAQDAGLVSGVSLNHSQPYNNQDYNNFDRSADMYQTQRAAEINPIYCIEAPADDILPIRSNHDLRTFTLKSPLMSDLFMNRAFYQIPLQAIYPHTYQPLFKPQVHGSEIPDDAKPRFPLTFISGNTYSLSNMINYVHTNGFSSSYVTATVYFRSLLFFISLFSRDGLLIKLGYGFPDYGADDLFASILGNDLSAGIVVTYSTPSNPSQSVTFKASNQNPKHRYILMQLLYGKYQILTVTMADPSSTSSQFYDEVKSILYTNLPSFAGSGSNPDSEINLEKVIAYQLTCAKFYTNPFIDDINTSYKWLLNNETMAFRVCTNSQFGTSYMPYFTLNGVNYQYDLISYFVLRTLLLCTFRHDSYSSSSKLLSLNVLSNIFEIHNSLRYTDYFVDSRTRPLAVGDVYSAVTGQGVSAIDINRNLWIQRFLNAAGRVADNMRDFSKYIKGVTPDTIEPEPFIISKERFLLSGQEIENTSNTNQGNVVTNLRSSQSNFVFEVHIKEDSIILGLNSYSVKYAYGVAMEKSFETFDRFDRFNVFLQHIGDQTVLYHELNNDKRNAYYYNTFGYQVRFAQYKTALSHATGGFLDDSSLRSWIALFDKTNALDYGVLNTEFIRNQNIDFDDYYSSLTGMKMTTYYHFICRFTTICNAQSRQQKYPSLM